MDEPKKYDNKTDRRSALTATPEDTPVLKRHRLGLMIFLTTLAFGITVGLCLGLIPIIWALSPLLAILFSVFTTLLAVFIFMKIAHTLKVWPAKNEDRQMEKKGFHQKHSFKKFFSGHTKSKKDTELREVGYNKDTFHDTPSSRKKFNGQHIYFQLSNIHIELQLFFLDLYRFIFRKKSTEEEPQGDTERKVLPANEQKLNHATTIINYRVASLSTRSSLVDKLSSIKQNYHDWRHPINHHRNHRLLRDVILYLDPNHETVRAYRHDMKKIYLYKRLLHGCHSLMSTIISYLDPYHQFCTPYKNTIKKLTSEGFILLMNKIISIFGEGTGEGARELKKAWFEYQQSAKIEITPPPGVLFARTRLNPTKQPALTKTPPEAPIPPAFAAFPKLTHSENAQ